MDWVLIIFLFGALAAVSFLVSLVCFGRRRYKPGLLFACLELLTALPPTLLWMYALKVSGKSDWQGLGILNYPLAALCFCAMFVAGAVCYGLNLWGAIWGKKPAGRGPKTKADGEETSGE